MTIFTNAMLMLGVVVVVVIAFLRDRASTFYGKPGPRVPRAHIRRLRRNRADLRAALRRPR